MGPIALFDKSFLQSLSVDESVWFGHFFSPVVCPLFYVETLADLEKAVRDGRTPEREVGIIANKFPEQSAMPTAFHGALATEELFGSKVEMDGRPIQTGGRLVERDGKKGIVYRESAEAKAFSRWQEGHFLEIEREIAKEWRTSLKEISLSAVATQMRDLGLSPASCQSLTDARAIAASVVSGTDHPFARMALVLLFLGVPREQHRAILERWSIAGYRRLADYAPYAAHVLTVELFFQFAIAGGHIGTAKPSNRVDVAYLNYVPFTMIFVSSDNLHRRCSPLFMRDNQRFVWGPDLKHDLKRINDHFSTFPESEKQKGIIAFAHAPPFAEDSIVCELRSKLLRPGIDREPHKSQPSMSKDAERKLVAGLKKWTIGDDASSVAPHVPEDEIQMVSIERKVRKRKGSWWQLPRDLDIESSDN